MNRKLNNIAQILLVGDKVRYDKEDFTVISFMLHLDMIMVILKNADGDIITVKPHGLFKIEEV